MLLKFPVFFYLKSLKQIRRITAAAVICCKHFNRHGLSKPPRPADADEFFFCIDKLICIRDKSGLVYINFRPD